LEQEMAEAAEVMDFEQAAILRDQIFELKATGK
jgi:protein-arginine kinase activator protein McsA